MALSIQLSYVISVILGRFGIAPWSLEMGPNTSIVLSLPEFIELLLLLKLLYYRTKGGGGEGAL